jgi:hypothetical protein
MSGEKLMRGKRYGKEYENTWESARKLELNTGNSETMEALETL